MYVKLFRDMLDSTVWMQPDHVLRVFITLLLLADKEGFVETPIPALALRARVSLDDAIGAIEILESPDEFSRTAIEEGRRLIRVTDEKTLWKIVNYEYYRSMRSAEQKRAYQREYMREYRKRNSNSSEDDSEKDSQCEAEVNGLAQAEAEAEAEADTHTGKIDFNPFMDLWNEVADETGLSKITKITEPRRKAIRARIKEFSEDAINEVLAWPKQSKFLRGETGRDTWKGASFDWLLRPTNFPKVLEGNYADKGAKKNGRGRDAGKYDSTL